MKCVLMNRFIVVHIYVLRRNNGLGSDYKYDGCVHHTVFIPLSGRDLSRNYRSMQRFA